MVKNKLIILVAKRMGLHALCFSAPAPELLRLIQANCNKNRNKWEILSKSGQTLLDLVGTIAKIWLRQKCKGK